MKKVSFSISIVLLCSLISIQIVYANEYNNKNPSTSGIGNYVWHDINGNGIQDGEIGLQGVEVELLTSSGNFLESTVTSSGGFYLFDGLSAGSYIIRFNAPSGYEFTPKNTGNNGIDSDASPSTGESDIINLGEGEVNNAIDAGFFQFASVGDFCFRDVDLDGVQDNEDYGYAGMELTLEGVTGSGESFSAITFSDSYGLYLFQEVPPGNYQVEFTVPPGFSSTTFQSTTSQDDSDAPISDVFTLISGEDDNSIDGGFYLVPPEPCNNSVVYLCNDVDVVCDLNDLHEYCTTMLEPWTPQDPAPLCPEGGYVHNPVWLGFVAGEQTAEIIVHANNCYVEQGELGLQYAVFTDCSYTEAVVCHSACVSELDFTIELENLTQGQDYYLIIDGCVGTVCDIWLEVVSGGGGADVNEASGIYCDSPSGDCNILCAGQEYNIILDGASNASNYVWTLDGETMDGFESQAINLIFENTGTFELCAYGENACSSSSTICQSIEVIELDATYTIQNADCNGNCNGSIEIDEVLNGISPINYEWSNGETGSVINGLCAGEYSVSISDINACILVFDFEISEPDLIELDLNIEDESYNDANDGSISVLASGGVLDYYYIWSNGEISQTISSLSPGDYSVTVIDGNACEMFASGTVNEFICPDLVIDNYLWNIPCYGECTGEIGINSIINGSFPFEYLWSDGQNQDIAYGLCPGNYDVTVTDGYNCEVVSELYTISQPDSLSLEFMVLDESENNANDGQISVLVGGGTNPYSYYWSNGQSSQTIENLTPGIYYVTITDNYGCQAFGNAFVQEFGCQNLIVASNVIDPGCFGFCDGMITISEVENAIEPIDYSWSNGINGNEIDSLCSGIFQVTITDGANCVIIEEYELIQPQVLENIYTIGHETSNSANDGTIEVYTSGGTPPYEYQWSNGKEGNTINGLEPGIYYVTLTDLNECLLIDTLEVFSFECPLFNVTADVQNLECFNNCIGSIQILDIENGLEPFTYSWSTGDNTNLIAGLCSGSYIVSITDQNYCADTLVYEVSSPTSIYSNIGSTDASNEDANDGTIFSYPTGGVAPYGFLWSTGDTEQVVTELGIGDYYLTITDSQNCEIFDSVKVSNAGCSLVISDIAVNFESCFEYCDGSISVLDVSNSFDPIIYNWSNGESGNTIENLCSGDYVVTITDAVNCILIDTFSLPIQDKIEFSIDTIIHITDDGPGAILISGIDTTKYEFNWNGPESFQSSESSISLLVEDGCYTLTIIDLVSLCSLDTIICIDDLSPVEDVLNSFDRILLYPNPASGSLIIEMGNLSFYPEDINLIDLDGKSMQTSYSGNNSKYFLDLGNVIPGKYIVLIQGHGIRIYRKILIVK